MSDPRAFNLILPAVEEPAASIDTEAGRLTVPARRIPEKAIPIRPSWIADLTLSARRAAALAHAPYSAFPVGAAVIMADDTEGRIFTGCNVENASYGATLCAERSAIHTAVAAGFRRIGIVAVSTVKSLDGPLEGRSPCGLCRQVIREFADDSTLIVIDSDQPGALGEIMDIDRLLPWGFSLVGEPPLLPQN